MKKITIAFLFGLLFSGCEPVIAQTQYWEPTAITITSLSVADSYKYWVQVSFNVQDSNANYLARLTPPQQIPFVRESQGFYITYYNVYGQNSLNALNDSVTAWVTKNFK